MVIDTSGNLGLGVTPSAWNSDYKVFQLGVGASIYGRVANNETTVAQNWYRDTAGNFKYIANGYAGSYSQLNGGGHAWYVAPNNTSGAGAALSLSQAMTLDASGNLGVGTSTNALTNRLTLYATGSTAQYLATGNSNTGLNGALFGVDGTGNAVINNTQNLAMLFSTNNTERARITAGGYSKFSNNGTYVNATSSQYEFRADPAAALVLFDNRNASTPNGLYVDFSAASPDNNTQYFLYCEDSTTARVILYSDGDGQNHDNSWGGISDERLKQDIVDANSQWDDIKNLRVRKYRFKSDVEEGKEHQQIGLIAQEVLDVSPGLVTGSEDTQYGVQYSVLYMKAVKALQEAMTRIEQLEAEVSALKGA
jgi:hypothetical protein